MSHRGKIFLAIGICVVLFIGCVFILPEKDRIFINYLGIIGFWISILGIVIAYLQILSVKEIAQITQEEVKESIKMYSTLLMLSDLSRKAAMVDEIQGFLKADKIELCVLRMKDLKTTLNNLTTQDYYGKLLSKKDFKTTFQNFTVDLYNLQRHDLSTTSKLDKPQILINLEKLSSLLLNVEIKLKSVNHDS